MSIKSIDITPTPRILRTLGEIPFQPWQCIAELIDNAVDAFAESEKLDVNYEDKRICAGAKSQARVMGPNK